jgi:3-hydroxybutyrate dehydrogenase
VRPSGSEQGAPSDSEQGGALTGRKALVTGGASGIGAAICRALAESGATVTVADLNADAAQALAEELGGRAWAVDLTRTEQLAGLKLEVDILVNNAGIQHVAAIEEFPPEKFRAILSRMLEAPFLLTRAALPYMYAQGFGRVINISSVHGLRASPYKSAYVAAKHGLEGLSKVIALEGGGKGVTSVCVNPSYVRTPLVDKQVADQAKAHGISQDEVLEKVFLAGSAVKRLAEPAEVASLVLWLCGESAGLATGTSFSLDGGWTAH